MEEIRDRMIDLRRPDQGDRSLGPGRGARGVGLVRLPLQRLRPAVGQPARLGEPARPHRPRRRRLPALAARPAPPERGHDRQARPRRLHRPLLPAGRRVRRRRLDRDAAPAQPLHPVALGPDVRGRDLDRRQGAGSSRACASGWRPTTTRAPASAITEYNWGAEGHINGATTQADILGIFGREGLDLATRWTTPDPSTPTYKAMKMYRNYDGAGGRLRRHQRPRDRAEPGRRCPRSRPCAPRTAR